ncbi:hypothetical protein [uncultured Sunxiuqinia sp.]|uniref:hypothetical protein n=1 Tax=uncultured Sunxiuqinia sp. TaxID=1573825 RepID=UPI002AA8FF3F|nr:hypothetical protein [uncultured Sunxiuqinia sp.]
MNKDRLEEFVRNNSEDFDIYSPSPEVWEKLNEQLTSPTIKQPKNLNWLKIAAVIALAIIGSGVVVTQLMMPDQQYKFAQEVDPEMKELIEAEAYYAQQVDGKLREIRKCYQLIPELQMEVEDDLQELESMYNNLKTDLKENVSNKEVIEAMIENNRFRMKLVDQVLEQINC